MVSPWFFSSSGPCMALFNLRVTGQTLCMSFLYLRA
jgi:hypothetical protein